jgi:hypothetical protein
MMRHLLHSVARPGGVGALAAGLLAACAPWVDGARTALAASAEAAPVTAAAVTPDSGPGGGVSAAVNRLTDAERQDGWQLLFDGTTLRGWRGLGRDTVPTAHWTVDSGAIHKVPSGQVAVQADGQPLGGGDLTTDASYGDFELTWEWKVAPGANSGVKYNVSEQLSTSIPPRNAAKGFEYQIVDDDRHPDGKLIRHRTGDLYDLLPSNERKRVRPVGEWNQSRILFRGTHGEHWLNGEKVVEYDLGTARMTQALAASEYRAWSWFGQRRRTPIVLQDDDDAVWFRSLKIRDIGPAQR